MRASTQRRMRARSVSGSGTTRAYRRPDPVVRSQVDGDELEAPGHGAAVSGGVGQAVDDAMLEPGEHVRLGAKVLIIDEHSPAEQIRLVAFEDGIDDGVKEGMSRPDQGRR